MIISIGLSELVDLVARQLASLFTFDKHRDMPILKEGINRAVMRAETCFSPNTTKYFQRDGEVYFSPFHSAQYSMFLYFLSNSIWNLNENQDLADRVYYLNKALNSVDLFYEVELPAIFTVDHPLGTVLGRAKYSDFLIVAQNCTVGNNRGVYPTLGKNVVLHSGAMVIGDCQIGNNCAISAKTFIKDQDVPDNSLVFGSSPNLVIKTKEKSYFWELHGKWAI